MSHVTWMRGNVTCYLDVRSATLYLDGVLLFDEERALLLPLEQGLDGGQGAWQRGGHSRQWNIMFSMYTVHCTLTLYSVHIVPCNTRIIN